METERLLIRRFKSEDWMDLYDYLSQEEVVKYEPYEVFSMEQCQKEAINWAGNESFWAICLKETGKLIGNIYLSKGDFDTWELGYVFNKEYHNFGYATEAAWTLVNDAFINQQARRVIAMCNPYNISSWKLMERLNMRREAHKLQNIYFKKDDLGNPIWLDTYEYAILDSEWLKLNKVDEQ